VNLDRPTLPSKSNFETVEAPLNTQSTPTHHHLPSFARINSQGEQNVKRGRHTISATAAAAAAAAAAQIFGDGNGQFSNSLMCGGPTLNGLPGNTALVSSNALNQLQLSEGLGMPAFLQNLINSRNGSPQGRPSSVLDEEYMDEDDDDDEEETNSADAEDEMAIDKWDHRSDLDTKRRLALSSELKDEMITLRTSPDPNTDRSSTTSDHLDDHDQVQDLRMSRESPIDSSSPIVKDGSDSCFSSNKESIGTDIDLNPMKLESDHV
jgi:hypothetical protein